MKNLKREEEDRIQRWEDVPLASYELNKRDVLNNDDILCITNICENLSIFEVNKLRGILKKFDRIYFDVNVDSDYDSYVSEIRIIGGGIENETRLETDKEYKARLVESKKRIFEAIEKRRLLRKKKEEKLAKLSEEKNKDEFELYMRLKQKYED